MSLPSQIPSPAALAEENRRLRAQLDAFVEQARRNQQIIERHQAFDIHCLSAGSFRELVGTIVNHLKTLSQLDTVTLALLDPDREIRGILEELHIALYELPGLLFVDRIADLPSGKPLLGRYQAAAHRPLFPAQFGTPASIAVIPLLRHRRPIGTLNLGSGDAQRFNPSMATDFIEHMASIVAISVENMLNQERLQHLGLTDPLTGVHNRRYLEARLKEEILRMRRQNYPLSCLYIDIDHFKQINDRVGHHAGDQVLREVASRIKAELRASDALGRFGGEEFVVLLINADLDAALLVAERIRAGIANAPVRLDPTESLRVTASLGVAALPRLGSTNAEAVAQKLIDDADQSLYRAKAQGRNCVIASTSAL